jgi:hypothetical protein
MSKRPLSAPVLIREQPRAGAPMDGEPRVGVTWDRFRWRGAANDPGVGVMT